MKKTLIFLVPLMLASFLANAQQSGVDTLSLKSIFYQPLLAGHRPDFVGFVPKKKALFYHANDSSMKEDELFSVPFNGKNKQRRNEKRVHLNYRLSHDKSQLAYIKDGDLWIANADFSTPHALVASNARTSNPTWAPDRHRLAFVENGDVWVMDADQSALRQITHKKKKAPGYRINGWAGPDKLVLTQYDRSGEKVYYFPEYVHQYVQPGASRRGVSRKIVSVVRLDSMQLDTLYDGRDYINSSIAQNGAFVALDRVDESQKHHLITTYHLAQGNDSVTVFRDSTKGWMHGTNVAFAPDGDKLMIQSEKDGWNHIYTVNADGSGLQKWTAGSYEVPWAQWIDTHHIVFASTREGPGQRQLYTVDTRDGSITPLTDKPGYRESFELSPDKQHVIYKYSFFNQPWELYSLDLHHPNKETRLTHTIPERFKKMNWPRENYIRFTGRDSTTRLSMSVLKPRHMRKDGRYPVVVFVHGAGTLQNVFQGWSNHYYREYMFNQFLTAHGYFVIEVDYRQSLGYGRKFREDVAGWMGKYETQDIEDGIDYLAAHYAQADTSRTGIYGGSYGGFMSLYATSVAPAYFDAAASLRPVTNWKNYYYYNPWYTRPRLGTPQADSANYALSSPLTYVDSLKHPVLLLVGLRDRNVGFNDTAQYVHALIEDQNNDFQMMMYPTQPHSFNDPDDWYDEYQRIFTFFEYNLK